MLNLSHAMTTIAPFVPRFQLRAIVDGCRGEEAAFFRAKIREYAERVATMPETYGQDGKGDAAIAHLHYFRGGADVWITEKDADPDIGPLGVRHLQAFGLIDLGYGPELGYVCLPEIFRAGLELDLHWIPCTLADIRARIG